MLVARIGGVVFDGSAQGALDAYVIGPEGWSGWDDAPAVRREGIARPAQHGSFGFPGYRDARVITISGWIVASSPMKLQHMRNRLLGLLADGGAGRLDVDQPLVSTWATVMLADTPTVKVRGQSELEASFQIQFWAPNPRKYGETREVSAGAMAVNRGNFPATPEHFVTGTSGSYTINGPAGKKFTVSSGPGAGTDRIDMATGRVYRNGTLQLGVTSRADLWDIPPGLPGVTHTITAGSLVTKVSDTFV